MLYAHEVKPVSDLAPYANNARIHSEKHIDQIVRSIEEFGFTNPVLIDENGGIIAGHGRVLAAKKLDMTELPCIVVTGLDEGQKKALILADNKIAMNAGWDYQLLGDELATLQEMDFDLSITGFDDSELATLITDPDLIDLNPEDSEEAASGANLLRLTFGKHRVELSQDEFNQLEELLEQYIESYGGTFGFISWFLDASS